MVISNLQGGLGNQMFEYAAGYALAKRLNTKHKIDLSHFESANPAETPRQFALNRFKANYVVAKESDLKKNILSDIFNKINFILVVRNYIKYPIHLGKDLYMTGYFQKEEYFKDYAEDIVCEFELKDEYLTDEYKKVLNEISSSKNSVSIHIRRGDYVTNPNANKHHGTLSPDYYESACELLSEKLGKINLFVFSDDIPWIKENMKFLEKYNPVYVSQYNFIDAQELMLMSKCSNNIIANSSFSWWGAWLNQNKGKVVIAPKSWLKNGDGINKGIVPKEWIRL